MGGEVVLSRCFQHLSGARYFFAGMILHQLGGNGEMGCYQLFGRGGLPDSHSSSESCWELGSLVPEPFDLAD